jgi:hypothetical protein
LKIKSSGNLLREINNENIKIDSAFRDKILEMFTDISEELKAELGNSFMIMLKNSCEEMSLNNIREDNKTYLYVTFN